MRSDLLDGVRRIGSIMMHGLRMVSCLSHRQVLWMRSNVGSALRLIIILMGWLGVCHSLVGCTIDMIMGLGMSCHSMRVLDVILTHSLLEVALRFFNLVIEALKAWNSV